MSTDILCLLLSIVLLISAIAQSSVPTAPNHFVYNRADYSINSVQHIYSDGVDTLDVKYDFPTAELQALHDLYTATDGENWAWKPIHLAGNRWDFSDPSVNPCIQHWQGLNCTSVAALNVSFVTGIHLFNYSLVGTLPSSIQYFTQLRYLILQHNDVNGTLPSTLGTLQYLKLLDLHGNHITGTLPGFLGSMQAMEILMLGRNDFYGRIPEEFGNFPNIVAIDIGNNDITGQLPESLSQLGTIQHVLFFFNRISGTLPASYSNLTKIVTFNVFNNSLMGTIPEMLCSWIQLESLTLGVNSFKSTIPSCIADLPVLYYIDFFRNQLTGTIPASFANMDALEVLYLNQNQFHGAIDVLCEISTLKQFYLQQNQLSGTVPSCLGNLPVLNDLYLAGNRYTGTIPPELGNIYNMKYIDLSMNDLTGTIPETFADLSLLTFLFLFHNRLHGSIPPAFSQLSNLSLLLLQDNQFTGSIEHIFDANVQTRLSTIQLSNNAFTGVIPDAPFHSKVIFTFSVVDNCLHGTIPTMICESRSLSVLALDGMGTAEKCRSEIMPGLSDSYIITQPVTGGIPTCLFQMPNLTTLHVSGNGIKGSLPYDLTLGPVLLDLAMSHNVLTGSIPLAIQERVWYSLDLSYNRFSGSLESTFNTLPVKIVKSGLGVFNLEVVYVSQNEMLSLENNRISGDIPDTVYDLTDLAILEGNLFTCRWDQSDLPQSDSAKDNYQCGSSAFNAQYYAWLIISFTFITTAYLIRQFRKHVERYFVVKTVVDYFEKWFYATDAPALQGKLKNFKYVCVVAETIGRAAFWVTVILVLVFVPLYAICSHFYGTIRYQYAWTISAAYLSGPVAFALLFVFFVALLFFILALMQRYKRIYLKIEADEDADYLPEVRATIITATKQQVYSAYGTFYLINFAVVIGVNVAFVYIALYEDNTSLVIAQICLSFFKGFWNSYGAMYLMRWSFHLVATDETCGADFINTQLFVTLFNNIGIPCLVIAAISRNCYYNFFVLAPAVNSRYLYFQCAVFIDDKCLFYFPTLGTTQYSPPFTYSFQCSAQFITSYAPTFVYLALEVAFLNPIALMISTRLHARATPGTLWFRFLDYWIVYPNLKPFDKTLTGAVRRDPYNPFFDANQLVVLLMTYLGVILTFGVVFPPLAVVMLVAIASQILTNRLVMGRYISTALEEQLPQYLDAIELDSQGVGLLHLSRLRVSMWMVVWYCCCFYILYFFDTLGNDYGTSESIWIFPLMPLVPLGLYALSVLSRKKMRDRYIYWITGIRVRKNSKLTDGMELGAIGASQEDSESGGNKNVNTVNMMHDLPLQDIHQDTDSEDGNINDDKAVVVENVLHKQNEV